MRDIAGQSMNDEREKIDGESGVLIFSRPAGSKNVVGHDMFFAPN